MIKGFLHTLIYYAVCWLTFFLLELLWPGGPHLPGMNYFFLLLILIISFFLMFVNVAKIIAKRERGYNAGALLLHLPFAIFVVTWYLIGYYSQFG